jgi:hypothetical protein
MVTPNMRDTVAAATSATSRIRNKWERLLGLMPMSEPRSRLKQAPRKPVSMAQAATKGLWYSQARFVIVTFRVSKESIPEVSLRERQGKVGVSAREKATVRRGGNEVERYTTNTFDAVGR